MASRNQDFVLGLTLLIVFGLGVGSFVFLTEFNPFAPPMRDVTIHFSLDDGMTSVQPGSPVLLGAVEVGKVTEVGLRDWRRGDLGRPGVPIIEVHADVVESLTLYQDVRITSSAPVIGGMAFLTILHVGASGELLPEDAIVLGEPPQSLQSAINVLSEYLIRPGGLLDQLDRIFDGERSGSVVFRILTSLEDVNAVTAALRRQLSADDEAALMAKVHTIAENVISITAQLQAETDRGVNEALMAKVHTALDRLNDSLRTIRGVLGDVQPRLTASLDNVQTATGMIAERVIPPIAAELDRSDDESLLAKVRSSVDVVRSALDDVRTVTTTARVLVVSNRPLLDRAILNVSDASRDIRSLVADILLNPWRMFSPSEREKERQEIFQAAQLFASAAARLDDLTAQLEALREAGDDSTIAQERIDELTAALDRAFERFELAEQYFYEQIK